MAEKIVELSKLAPFGLKRPTPEDAAALERSNKRSINHFMHKLWTHEARMFAEKTFYLNKSTTKYIIIGNDVETFEAAVKICDRTTGSHITISRFWNITEFFISVGKLIKTGEIQFDDTVVDVEKLPGEMWKFTQKIGYGSIVLHKISLQNLIPIITFINCETTTRHNQTSRYVDALDIYKDKMSTSSAKSKEEKIREIAAIKHEETIPDDLASFLYGFGEELIIIAPHLETLEKYAMFYN